MYLNEGLGSPFPLEGRRHRELSSSFDCRSHRAICADIERSRIGALSLEISCYALPAVLLSTFVWQWFAGLEAPTGPAAE
jgi:hypothetical protein